MKMAKVTTRKAWTDDDNRQLIALYNYMLVAQATGDKINKAKLFRDLGEKQGRSKSSCECKAMNVSAVRQNLLGLPIVQGLKALDNYNKALVDAVKADLGIKGE